MLIHACKVSINLMNQHIICSLIDRYSILVYWSEINIHPGKVLVILIDRYYVTVTTNRICFCRYKSNIKIWMSTTHVNILFQPQFQYYIEVVQLICTGCLTLKRLFFQKLRLWFIMNCIFLFSYIKKKFISTLGGN